MVCIVMAAIFIMKPVTDNSATGKKKQALIPDKLSIKEQHDYIATRLRIMSAHSAYIGEHYDYTNTSGMQNTFAGSFSNTAFIGFHSTNKATVFSGGLGNINILPHSKTPLLKKSIKK